MDQAKLFLSSFGGKADPSDPGDPIGQSLRFRKDVSDLSKTGMTGGSKIYTVSFWTKHGDSFGNFGLGIGSNTGGTEDFLGVVPSRSGKGENSPQVFGNGSNSGWVTFSEQFRDYSGWYHYHLTYDVGKTGADRVHCYVNGVEVTKRVNNATVGLNKLFQNTKTTIGNSWYQTADCYAAEFYVIDGQALDPTTFGRYNANGVWVPVKPTGLTYGTNGFYLTFEDPFNVGKDYSGNGNDFTATGFDTAAYVSGYWADSVYTATGGEIPNSQGQVYITDVQPADASVDYTNAHTIQNAFDGDLSTYIYLVGDDYTTGNVMSMTFDLRDYDDIQSLELLTAGGSPNTDHSYTVELLDASKTLIAGTQVKTSQIAYATPEWVSVPVSGTPRYFRLWTTPKAGDVYKRLYLFAISVNGKILSQSAVTAPTYDLMQDSPTNNFATHNPIGYTNYNTKLYNANLELSSNVNQTNQHLFLSTIKLEPGSKVYVENTITKTNNTALSFTLGLGPNPTIVTASPAYLGRNANQLGIYESDKVYLENVRQNSVLVPAANMITNAVGGYYMMAVDYDAGNVWYGTDGVWWNWDGAAWNFDATLNPAQPTVSGVDVARMPFVIAQQAYLTDALRSSINYGQQPFKYTPPTGFKDLNTANIPTPTIKNGRDHFQAITRPGSGGIAGNPGVGNWATMLYSAPNEAGNTYGTLSKSFSTNNPPELGFDGSTATLAQPDATGKWVVFKPDTPIVVATGVRVYTRNYNNNAVYSINKAAAQSNPLASGAIGWADLSFTGNLTELAIRDNSTSNTRFYALEIDGNVYVSESILSAAQAAFPSGLWWIKDRANSNQHQLLDSIRGTATCRRSPAATVGNYTAPTGDSVAWCWNAPDEFNDTASDIDSTGRRNVEAGFSIRKYTGNATTQQGIAHGLSATPEFIMVCRETTEVVNTSVWHKDLTANVDSRLVLETNAAVQTQADVWSQAPDSTNIYVGNNNLSNKSSTDYTAYLWTAIPGYSSFGSYKGNGNADGPFVYTGFRPAFVLFKNTQRADHWYVYDSTRDLHNPVQNKLYPNQTIKESSATDNLFDFMSNGFKIRTSASASNQSGETIIYAAFAENPFQSPATAR